MANVVRKLQVVRTKGKPRVSDQPPIPFAQWAAIEAEALVTIEDAAKRPGTTRGRSRTRSSRPHCGLSTGT